MKIPCVNCNGRGVIEVVDGHGIFGSQKTCHICLGTKEMEVSDAIDGAKRMLANIARRREVMANALHELDLAVEIFAESIELQEKAENDD